MEHPTVQDIFLRFYPHYLDKYTPSPQQSKVANCIINCKTGAYGANVSVCEDCGHLQIHYNSCRNRCCPMCQALPKEKWMDKRREDVLEAPYFHLVFTVPQELNPLIYSNQQFLYDAMYGLLCTRTKTRHLTLCRNLLGCKQYLSRLKDMETPQILETLYGIKVTVCKCCGGHLGKPQQRIPLWC